MLDSMKRIVSAALVSFALSFASAASLLLDAPLFLEDVPPEELFPLDALLPELSFEELPPELSLEELLPDEFPDPDELPPEEFSLDELSVLILVIKSPCPDFRPLTVI